MSQHEYGYTFAVQHYSVHYRLNAGPAYVQLSCWAARVRLELPYSAVSIPAFFYTLAAPHRDGIDVVCPSRTTAS